MTAKVLYIVPPYGFDVLQLPLSIPKRERDKERVKGNVTSLPVRFSYSLLPLLSPTPLLR